MHHIQNLLIYFTLLITFVAYIEGHRLSADRTQHSIVLILKMANRWTKSHGRAYEFGDGSTVNGDMIFTAEQTIAHRQRNARRQKRKAIRDTRYRWSDGIIPYQLDSSVARISRRAKETVRRAIAHWEENTCLVFEEYDEKMHGDNRLIFRRSDWCSSNVGMIGGEQYLNLHPDCFIFGTVVHEIGHALGFYHEHNRPDRDNYISLRESRIPDDFEKQYEKLSRSEINTYGVPYDYYSIMHYPANGVISTTSTRAMRVIGQRERLSFYDAKLANLMYQCPNLCPKTITCQAPGYIGPKCTCICHPAAPSCAIAKPSTPNSTFAPTTPVRVTVEGTTLAPSTNVPATNCRWLRASGKKATEITHQRALHHLSERGCRRACLEEMTFKCQSFHYKPSGKLLSLWSVPSRCYLSKEIARPGAFARSSYTYFQRPECLNVLFCGWKLIEGKYLRGHNTKTLRSVSAEQCRLSCLEETSFTCNSFDYNTNERNCFLSEKRVTDASMLSTSRTSGLDYYERMSCAAREETPNICPYGNQWRAFEGRCYKIVNTATTFHVARNNCRRYGGYMMKTRTYLSEIRKMAISRLVGSRFYWIESNLPKYRKQIGSRVTKCSAVKPMTRRPLWYHQTCYQRLPYVCERNPRNLHSVTQMSN